MPEKDADIQKIKELIRIMQENDLVKIDLQHGDDRVSLQRAEPHASVSAPILTGYPHMVGPVVQAAPPGQKAGAATAEHLQDIKSPLVGTFYEGPSPDSDPYVEIGSQVDTQTVVCIIEAMKVMNEVKAEVNGTIAEKLVKNGQAIEYGQVLFRVRPD